MNAFQFHFYTKPLEISTSGFFLWGLNMWDFFIEAEVEKLPLQLELLCLQGCRCLCLMLCVCGCLVCPEVDNIFCVFRTLVYRLDMPHLTLLLPHKRGDLKLLHLTLQFHYGSDVF